jgi:hypothetical protein
MILAQAIVVEDNVVSGAVVPWLHVGNRFLQYLYLG